MWLYLFIMLSKHTYSLTIFPSQVFPDYDSWKNKQPLPQKRTTSWDYTKRNMPKYKEIKSGFYLFNIHIMLSSSSEQHHSITVVQTNIQFCMLKYCRGSFSHIAEKIQETTECLKPAKGNHGVGTRLGFVDLFCYLLAM